MREAVRTQLLPPCDFGEARTIRPRRDLARLRRLDSNVVAEHEPKSIVVAAIGGAQRLPVLELRIERESIELRLYRRQGHRCGGLSGARRRYCCRGLRTDAFGRIASLTCRGRPWGKICLQRRQLFRRHF